MTATSSEVLVVDDDPAVLDLLNEFLSSEGYHVECAASVESALFAVDQRVYPVIITDLVMPGSSGFDLMDAVAERGLGSKIIVLTGQGGVEEAVKAFTEKNAFHFLRKPVRDLASLRVLVQRAGEAFAAQIERTHLMADLKAANYLASIDGLTGLFSHRRFYLQLAEEINAAQLHGGCLSLLFIDADHFKRINDRYGHPVGDACLSALADSVRQFVRASDFVARYGGEELAILLPQTASGDAYQLAERLREGVPRTWPAELPELTVSIGVAEYPSSARDSQALVKAADSALLQAKFQGRNRTIVYGRKPTRQEASIEDIGARLRASAWSTVEDFCRQGASTVASQQSFDAGLSAAAQALDLSDPAIKGVVDAFRVHDLGEVAERKCRPDAASGRVESPKGERRRPLPDCETGCRGETTLALIRVVADFVEGFRALEFHREHWDGSGPAGRTGKSIPAAARLLSVALAYRAATSHSDSDDREWVPAALRELAGRSLDPTAVEAFLQGAGYNVRNDLDLNSHGIPVEAVP